MEKVEISPSSALVGHRQVQHGRRAWRRSPCGCYHTYLIPENHVLTDALLLRVKTAFMLGADRTPCPFKM